MRKYAIPQFSITELVRGLWPGIQIHETRTATYCPCRLGHHDKQPQRGDLRLYDHDDGWGGWVCHKHGRGSVWDLVENHFNLPGFDARDDAAFDDTIAFVCEKLGRAPRLRQGYVPDPSDEARTLMRELAKAIGPIEFDEPNQHFRDGLYRGLDPMKWLAYDVGMISRRRLTELFETHGLDAFKAAGLVFKDDWYEWIAQGVVVLRRSSTGVPVGLGVRRYEEFCKVGDAKYFKNTRHTQLFDVEAYVFNERAARRADHPVVYVVEGEFDALKLTAYGYPAVSWGSGIPTAAQQERLLALGKPLVMVPDTDPSGAGFKNAHEIARALPQTSFVFLPAADNGKADADTYLDAAGGEAFGRLQSYTALEVDMMATGISEGRWHDPHGALFAGYARHIAAYPTPYDEKHMRTLCHLAQADYDMLKAYVRAERNRQLLEELGGAVEINLQRPDTP